MIIGLCGGSGSGKSTVANVFSSSGIPVIDADRVYHELVGKKSPCTDEIAAVFGERVLNPDGSLSRPKLAETVFAANNRNLLKKLNEISHRHVLAETRRRMKELFDSGYQTVVFDAPLLFESGFDKECDLTVCVVCPEEKRIARIVERDGISTEKARSRISSQISDFELRKKCRITIENDGTLEALTEKTNELIRQIKETE